MNFLIRNMVKEDTKFVQEIAKKSWNTTYAGIIPNAVQEKFLKSAYNDNMMEKRLRESYLFVAETENQVVGFTNFSPVKKDGEVELGAIYLYPEFQGKGIGTALLKEGMKNIEGLKKIYINVEKENTIGKTFYEAKGFQTVKEFDDLFDGHVLKTVRMVLHV